MDEIWKPVVGYEGLYEVSNLGRVKSLFYRNKYKVIKRELIMKPTRYLYYACVDLRKNGIRKVMKIHRLVAQAFLPNIKNLSDVCHISEKVDGNGFASNSVTNLFWGSKSDNAYDMYKKGRDNNPLKKGLFIHKSSHENRMAREIIQLHINGDVIRKWRCISDAAKYLGVTPGAISSALKGRTLTCRGFIWKYL